MNATSSVIEQLNQIQWRKNAEITPEASVLIDRHIKLIQPIVQSIVNQTGKSISDAHGIALTPAYETQEYDTLHDIVSEKMDFSDAVISWPIIMTIVAHEVWHLDSELSHLPNPWTPIIGLYQLGYPAGYLDAPDQSSVHLIVYLRDGEMNYFAC